MINPFQYIFYRAYCFYRSFDEIFPEISATGFLSCCQSANVLSILPIVLNINSNNWLIIMIVLSLFIINGRYFSAERIKQLEARWGGEVKKQKRIRGYMIIGYIIGTIVFFIYSLGLYSGYSNWKWEF